MPNQEHPIFRKKPRKSAKLWRYLTFAKLAALFQSSAVHFTRVDQFDDHFEGAWPKQDLKFFKEFVRGFDVPEFTRAMRRAAVASCWIEMPHESAAMWRLYCPGSEGIAITTTFGKLQAAVHTAADTRLAHDGWLSGVGRVGYVDHANRGLIDLQAPSSPIPNSLAPFMIKNVSYEHEKEVRALVFAKPNFEINPAGWDLEIDTSNFIDEIIVTPFAHDWFHSTVVDLAMRYELREKVTRSVLTPDLFYMRDIEGESGN